ncbi:MAG: AsmA family protein [Dysgonamonadaceae bacterium]|jgi:hypothetical protein|nr:AsmA family protein [Dysgonamonadaceae bacterium]
MKKFLKITGITLLAIILVLVALPFVFKGKIVELLKSEINKTIDAHVDFGHAGLNFFRSFPNATLSLDNFCMVGINEFEGDTLFYAGNVSTTINLKSLLGSGGYELVRMSADNAKLHAIVREDGQANWNIVKVENEEETSSESSDFKLLLKEVQIDNSAIYYDNDSSRMNLALSDLNLKLSGDMTADETRIKTAFTVSSMNFTMDKIPYLSQSRLAAAMNIDADLKNMKFTLADNHFQLNEIKANLDGWVAFPDAEKTEMDIRLNAPETQFKDILSMIPAIYAKDFKDLKTSGKASLEAWVKGVMTAEMLPAFNAGLHIAEAQFQYPGMPGSVTGIFADMSASNVGGAMDNTVLDIAGLRFNLSGNPFALQLHLSTPMSDPNLALSAEGKLNLDAIKDVYPLEDMDLSGLLDANLKLKTRMSYIEKEQFEKVEASGTLNLKQMNLKSKESDAIQIENANLAFSPRYVDLSALSLQIGKNDIKASGKLENFIPYFLKNETLKGNLAVNSNYLNLNDFMTEDKASASPDSTTVGLIEIPENIDFVLSGNFKQVIFDNLDMRNVVGQITVKDRKVDMKNLSMNALDGNLNVNGYYDTGKNPKQPDVSMTLNIQGASFAKTFSTFVTIRKLAPIFENLVGTFSTQFQLNTPLGENFMPELSSLTASGLLSSDNVEVSGNPVLDGLSSALKNESLKNLKIKDLKLPFSINDGRVTTKPFDIRFGDGSMNLQGSTGLDQSIDYMAKINLTGKLSNNYLNNVNVKIGGTFTKPKFNLDIKDAAGQLLDKIAGSALGSSETGATLSEQVDEQIEKQIENIRKQAKDAGDKLVAEAEKEGQKLINEANKLSNPIAKLAAVKTAEAGAKKLKDEAKKQADNLNTEAEKQIQALKDKAGK